MVFGADPEPNSDSFLTDELLREEVEYGRFQQRSSRGRGILGLGPDQDDGTHGNNDPLPRSRQSPRRSKHKQQRSQYQEDGLPRNHHKKGDQFYEEEVGPDDEEDYRERAHCDTPLRAQHDQYQYHYNPHLPQDGTSNNENINVISRSDDYYFDSNEDFSVQETTKNLVIGEEMLGQKLCWRSNPSQSLSDWKLNVFNRSTKTFETYHVHRVVLALGPRRCEYFQDVFRQAEAGTSASSASKITRVPLIAESCKLVGSFLDYVYGNDQFEITNENALGMCYLADIFLNHSLWDLATDFIEGDLQTVAGRENLGQYYTDSVYYDQDEFLDHILSVCSLHLLPMLEEGISCTNLLEEITPTHMLQVLGEIEQGDQLSKPTTSLYLTRLITEYCCLHRHELSIVTFSHFMSRVKSLDYSSALTLLETSLEYDLGTFATENDDDENRKGSISSLILFQRQCIATLSEEWEHLVGHNEHRVTRIMRVLALREEHQSMLVDWFQTTLVQASKKLLVSQQESETARQQVQPLTDRCETMANDLEAAQKETATAERNHNTTKSEMKTQISSWMRKNEATNQQRRAEQQQLEHERLRWEIERQQWKHEKSRLKRELRALRQGSAHQYSSNRDNYDWEEHSSSHSLNRHHQHQYYHHDDENRGREAITTSTSDSGHQHDRPFVIPNDCDSNNINDDSRSYVTDSSSISNSLVDVPGGAGRYAHDPHAYPLSNGMSPQFRIF